VPLNCGKWGRALAPEVGFLPERNLFYPWPPWRGIGPAFSRWGVLLDLFLKRARQLLPEFPVNLLESFLHTLFDPLSPGMEMFEFSEMFHPGLFLRCYFQFLLDRLRDELAQRNTPFSGNRLGAAE
jgi:hypothetical protein